VYNGFPVACENFFSLVWIVSYLTHDDIIENRTRNGIMVSLWCIKKNLIEEMVKNPENFDMSLVP